MVTTIILARHGETDWNRERRIQGHADQPLNETGRSQAVALARLLEGERLDAVYASDLSRAGETARLATEGRGLPVIPLAGLRERHFGSWEGLTDDEARRRFPAQRLGERGDGEALDAMSSRVISCLLSIAAGHPGGTVLVVAHGGPLHAVLVHCGLREHGPVGNCEVVRLEVEAERLVLVGDLDVHRVPVGESPTTT
mgnify:CR=1 FL=1